MKWSIHYQQSHNNLKQTFALIDLGQMHYFLGIQLSILGNGNIYLFERKYIIDLLSRAKMQIAKHIATPMTDGQKQFAYVT